MLLNDVKNVIYTCKGGCLGVALIKRESGRIMFCTLVEDDGTWFLSNNYWEHNLNSGGCQSVAQPTSSFWLSELRHCLEKTEAWLKHSAVYRNGEWFVTDKEKEPDLIENTHIS